MNVSVGRQGLWSLPGDGVLARQGDLILLSAIDERGLLDHLLDLLAKTSETGGDGRRFVDAVEDLVEGDETWGAGEEGQPGPAVVAFGPVGAGLAVTVSGTAWAEITTAHGTDRLAAAQPATVLRCVVGIPVYAVRGGLGAGRGGGDRTDRFSHLERGSIRAGGLSYHSGLTAMPVAAAPQGMAAPEAEPPLAPDVTALDVAGPDLAASRGPARRPKKPGPGKSPTRWSPPRRSRMWPSPLRPGPRRRNPKHRRPKQRNPTWRNHGRQKPRRQKPKQWSPGGRTRSAGARGPGDRGLRARGHGADRAAGSRSIPSPDGKSQIPDHPPTGNPRFRTSPDGESRFRPSPHGKSQIPDFEAAVPAEQPSAEVPPREATGAAGLPLPSADTPVDDLGAAAGAPIVLGVYCKNGHFGDPNARSCVVCGVSRGRRGPAPQPGPRPPLGALVLDDNSALELSADCVVGREPTLDPSVAAGEAHPLSIPDAAVSRVHARIHLDGWQVLLIDLGSVNGTRIRLPGKRSEQALEPNVPFPLQSGTRVLVGTQGFQYEAHRGR